LIWLSIDATFWPWQGKGVERVTILAGSIRGTATPVLQRVVWALLN
jgi:hypothetical protein